MYKSPISKEFFADLLNSLKNLSQEPVKEYLSSKTKDGHNTRDDFFDTTFPLLYAEDYYGYIDVYGLPFSPPAKYLYNIYCNDILKSLNEQLTLLRADFNTLKLVDLDGTIHAKFELLLETLIADITQDILVEIDKVATTAVDQSVDSFSFTSSSNNVYNEGVDTPIESQTMQWRLSVEKNTDGYSKYNLKAGEGYVFKQFFGDSINEIMLADVPMALSSKADDKLIFTGLPVVMGDKEPRINDFRNIKLIVYMDNIILTRLRLYSFKDRFCDYLP